MNSPETRSDPAYPVPAASMTDLYELTMAYGYWKLGRADERAVFSLFFRQAPYAGGFALAAGLERVIEYIRDFRFSDAEIEHLRSLTNAAGDALFEPAFLDYLAALELKLDIDALPEGTAVFAHEPLVRVEGPLLQAQLVESALLNLINFPTLVATKAAQVSLAAGEAPVLEFGLRRAQGPDGALTASRAAYLGGCAATSNVLAGRLFGIPVRGTHAHSWVLSFASEIEAFDSYLSVMPHNSVLLVDTYDSLAGVAAAIEAGRRLRAAGSELAGIRLDSGDLAYLSVQARFMLDEAGFSAAKIIASNDLDAETIKSLREQGASIDSYGVGTKLVTCYDQPALGGVYKLTAIEDGQGWRTPIKVSSEGVKTSIPGKLAIRRFYDRANNIARADMIFDELAGEPEQVIVDPTDRHRRLAVDPAWRAADLLAPVFRAGSLVYQVPSLEEARAHAKRELASLHPTLTRDLRPHRYPAGLDAGLHRRREALIEEALDAQSVPRAA